MSFKSLTILAALVAAASAAPAAVAPGEGPLGSPMPMIASCGDCLSNGYAWNSATQECVKKGCKSVDCVNDIVKCPVTPGEGPFPDPMPMLPSKPVHKPCADDKCEPIVPTPTPTEPCETETETPTPTGEPEPLKVCKNLPAGFCGGYMFADVAYSVPAMYDCVNKCEAMTLWCEVDEKSNEKYFYCCGNKCQTIPEQQTCKVDGKEYTVGVAYDIKLNGEKVTMWCTSETEYTTCKGKECGCSLELTPPGPAVCPAPPAPKPQPPAPQPPKPIHGSCAHCMKLGMAWNSATSECVKKGCKSRDCVNSLDQCPVTPGEGPFEDDYLLPATCGECLEHGLSWNQATKQCVKFGCKSRDCITDIVQCPVSAGEGPFPDDYEYPRI